jgi:cytosine/uracil/thiamine/allantoin permease
MISEVIIATMWRQIQTWAGSLGVTRLRQSVKNTYNCLQINPDLSDNNFIALYIIFLNDYVVSYTPNII